MNEVILSQQQKIPEGWAWRALRRVAEVKNSNVDKLSKPGEVAVRLCNYVDVYHNERVHLGLPFMQATATPSEVAAFRLRRDDVVITKDSESWTDIGVPALVVEEADDLLCGYHLARLRPQEAEIIGPFLYFALQTPIIANQLHLAARGVTRYGLPQFGIKSALLPVPDLQVQKLLVRYLDNAELRIARAIQAKQVLLGFLAERREVTVTNLVLGSTNASAEETWFGSLPAEWQVLPARALFRERIERGQPDLPLLSVTIKSGVMLQSDYLARSSKRDQSNVDRSSYKVARPGDIVYNKMRAWQGAAGLSRHLGIVSPAYVVQTPQAQLNPEFVAAVMRTGSFAKEAERLSYGITSDQWSLRPQHFKQILFPVPPRLEQDRICAALDTATRDIDAASDSLQREIDLLREYRIRLISDVVTGKQDVRAEASGMKDVDPVELAEALAGVTSAGNDELVEEDDAE